MLDIKPVASLKYNVLNGFNQSHIILDSRPILTDQTRKTVT